MARKYTQRSKEEKLAIVKDVLSGTPAQEYENKGIVDHHTVMRWVKKYEQDGEAGLETKRKKVYSVYGVFARQNSIFLRKKDTFYE